MSNPQQYLEQRLQKRLDQLHPVLVQELLAVGFTVAELHQYLDEKEVDLIRVTEQINNPEPQLSAEELEVARAFNISTEKYMELKQQKQELHSTPQPDTSKDNFGLSSEEIELAGKFNLTPERYAQQKRKVQGEE